jgi:nicotinate-nucleotide adenylyltransferase
LHAVTGAEVAFREFGVSPEVRGAIRWHTTGKPGMSTLEKVIYLADKLEETRDFPDVTEMRTIALTDLDSGLLIAMRDILESVKRRGLEPDPHSAEAIAFLEGHRSSSP